MILALDLGSTSFKAGVFDEGLRCVGQGAERLSYRFDAGGVVEFSREETERCLRAALSACLRSAAVVPAGIQAVGVTSQAQTFMVQDAAGAALTPFISWQDARAAKAAERLKADRRMADFAEHSSFGDLLAGLQVAQLRYLAEQDATVLALKHRVIHLPSYVVWRLTGQDVIDENLAAMSGLYSLRSGGWWPGALDAVGLSAGQLSRVIPIGGVAGLTGACAAEYGLKPGIPVVLAGNDQTAGACGAGIDSDGSVLITLGTAQVVYAVDRSMAPAAPARVRGPYPGGLCYRMAADSCGGSVVNWAKTVLAGCSSDAEFSALGAASPAGARGLVFEMNMSEGHGCWRNLGFHHQPGDMARAVVEALCRRMAAMVGELGLPALPDRIRVAGGGGESPLWRGILEATLKVRLERTDASPLVGAARLAARLPGR